MECAAGTDKIKVVPQGCKPVSLDRCASGFMAPAENVTFPKDPLETCCKCKDGEKCGYCLKETCTEDENKKYVTKKDCYPPPPPPPPEPEDKKLKEVLTPSFWRRNPWIIYMLGISFIIGLSFIFTKLSPKSAWRVRLLFMILFILVCMPAIHFLFAVT